RRRAAQLPSPLVGEGLGEREREFPRSLLLSPKTLRPPRRAQYSSAAFVPGAMTCCVFSLACCRACYWLRRRLPLLLPQEARRSFSASASSSCCSRWCCLASRCFTAIRSTSRSPARS